MKILPKLVICSVATIFVYFVALSSSSGRHPNVAIRKLNSETLRPIQDLSYLGFAHQAQVSGQVVQVRQQDPELSRKLRNYDLIKLDGQAAARQIRSSGRLLLKTSKGDFDLQIAPHDMRASDYIGQSIGPDGVAHKLPQFTTYTYMGSVRGLKDAQARMTVKNSNLEGAIITRGERYFFQPAKSLSQNRADDDFVFYRDSDVINEAGVCGVTLAEEVASHRTHADSETTDQIALSSPIPTISPLKIVRLATDADAEYVAALGGSAPANAQIMNIMNMVDGIYQVEIGLTFQIVFQNTWTDINTDPYSSTAPSTLLNQFRNHWNANFSNVQRNLAHLWTGKDLDGSVIGIARTPGFECGDVSFAYALSQKFPLSSSSITVQTVVLTAHEIGHGFSAAHTNQSSPQVPPDVEPSCQNTIMEAAVGDGSNFCPFSRSQIIGYANANSGCLLDSSSGPPPNPSCVETPISTTGSNTNGVISASDCRAPERGVRFFADQYSFNATAGQQVIITMNKLSGSLDPYLYLIGPDGYVIVQDDDSNGDGNARIPIPSFGPAFTLPLTGKYIVEATSFGEQQTGDYVVNVTIVNCLLSVSPASQNFPASGGSGVINVTAMGACNSYALIQFPGNVWLTPTDTIGSGSRPMRFTVQPNTDAAGRRAFLLVGPSGHIGGLRVPISQSGTGPDCSLTPIAFGQSVTGDLLTSDCRSPIRGSGFFTDRYAFTASEGQQISIALSSPSLDTFLTLIGPDGFVELTDDDSGGGTNSRIPGGSGMLTLGLPGTYIIEASTFEPEAIGPYSLTLAANAGGENTVQLSAASYAVGEGAGSVTITVTRTGNTSAAATVDYATSDTAGLASCTVIGNQASERCDYETTVGTLRFAAGESSKSFIIPIVDDVLLENSETFTITLRTAVGTTLGSPSSALVTINENDTAPATQNPIDGVQFFVTQQYLDFLSRLPDPTGLANWMATLNGCPNGGFGENDHPECDRVHVSSGFFLSPEFQVRGYWAYKFYEVGFDRRPNYAEFVPDMALVGGPQSPESEALSKAAYTDAFAQRTEFRNLYDTLTNRQYVDRLEQNAEVILSNKEALIQALDSGRSRAQVLRDIVESPAVDSRFFIRAFVSMQYFGYLRRDPDTIGFNNWVNTLNADPSNYRHMIFGFLFSTEYRTRFGP